MYFLCTGLEAKQPVLIQIIGSITLSGRLSFLICKMKRKYLPGWPRNPASSHTQALLVVCLLCDPIVSWAGNAAENKPEKNAFFFFLPPLSWHSGGSLPECSLNCRALCTVKEFLLFRLQWVWPVYYRCELSHRGSVSSGGPKRREVSSQFCSDCVTCGRKCARLEIWQSREEQKSPGRTVTTFPFTQPQSLSQEQTGPVCDLGSLETASLLGETFLHSVFGSLLPFSLCSLLESGSSGLPWCSNG